MIRLVIIKIHTVEDDRRDRIGESVDVSKSLGTIEYHRVDVGEEFENSSPRSVELPRVHLECEHRLMTVFETKWKALIVSQSGMKRRMFAR